MFESRILRSGPYKPGFLAMQKAGRPWLSYNERGLKLDVDLDLKEELIDRLLKLYM